ncbi:MAG: RDD family protein [Methylophilus sp.]
MSNYKFLIKRLIACVYDALILIAIWMLVTWFYIISFGEVSSTYQRSSLQLFLWLSAGVYFIFSWYKGGQTMALKAWKMKIVSHANTDLSFKVCFLRYALASVLIMLFGSTLFWAFLDKDRLFLHDRLLKTKCIQL